MRLKRRTRMSLAVWGCVTCFAFSLPYEAEGKTLTASWYGSELEGAPTASGEPYDPSGFTVAHKTLPLGTKLNVCLEGCVEVLVNDRGPSAGGRDLDLSGAAAEEIGLDGIGVVSVERAETPTTEAPEPPVKELPRTGGPQ